MGSACEGRTFASRFGTRTSLSWRLMRPALFSLLFKKGWEASFAHSRHPNDAGSFAHRDSRNYREQRNFTQVTNWLGAAAGWIIWPIHSLAFHSRRVELCMGSKIMRCAHAHMLAGVGFRSGLHLILTSVVWQEKKLFLMRCGKYMYCVGLLIYNFFLKKIKMFSPEWVLKSDFCVFLS